MHALLPLSICQLPPLPPQSLKPMLCELPSEWNANLVTPVAKNMYGNALALLAEPQYLLLERFQPPPELLLELWFEPAAELPVPYPVLPPPFEPMLLLLFEPPPEVPPVPPEPVEPQSLVLQPPPQMQHFWAALLLHDCWYCELQAQE